MADDKKVNDRARKILIAMTYSKSNFPAWIIDEKNIAVTSFLGQSCVYFSAVRDSRTMSFKIYLRDDTVFRFMATSE